MAKSVFVKCGSCVAVVGKRCQIENRFEVKFTKYTNKVFSLIIKILAYIEPNEMSISHCEVGV